MQGIPEPPEQLLRQILAKLAGFEDRPETGPHLEIPAQYYSYVCDWLRASHLAPIAYSTIGKSFPDMAEMLREDYYGAVVRYERQHVYLHNFLRDFSEAEIPVLLLKGVSIVPIAYSEPYHRFMFDLDIAVPIERLTDAWESLQGDMVHFSKPELVGAHIPGGPDTDKDGKLELQLEQYHDVQLDVHTTIYPGFWIDIATNIDESGLWERAVPAPLESFENLNRLSNEDLLLHIIVHAAISHQFDRTAMRNFIDFRRLTQRLNIDWDLLVARAKEWKVATTVWFYLHLYQELLGDCLTLNPDIVAATRQLTPSPVKQRALARFISPQTILDLEVLRHSRKRYFFLTLLVDKPGDFARLLFSIPFIFANRTGT